MKICAIVPSCNHYQCVAAIVSRLRDAGLPVFIIDDGSSDTARSALAELHNSSLDVIVYRSDRNLGKGAAVVQGFRLAIAAGFTHALQIDADGQHDLSVLPRLIKLAETYPVGLVTGVPVYDNSIPRHRKVGRWITQVWVWIETLSFRISDSMCGLRIYPLASVQKLLAEEKIGSHMDFDTDIIVRLFWRGVAPIMTSVKVIYPKGNTSNFDMVRDNWRITTMHTRLVITMVLRLPKILANRPPKVKVERHWAELGERGAAWGIWFCIGVYRLLGERGFKILLAPIVFYFYLAGSVQRDASRQFLAKALRRAPSVLDGYRHQMSFAMRALDVFRAWAGDIPASAVESTDDATLAAMRAIDDHSAGGLIIVAHLGNVDLARAVLQKKTRDRLTILAHTRHAENYNNVLRRFRAEAAMNILQVTEIGPETVIDLKQRVERGEWVVIAGDRISVRHKEHSQSVAFFGAQAKFPEGPWVLAGLLQCPVYLLFCLKDGERYRLAMEQFAENIELSRLTRQKDMRTYITRYAATLEHYSAQFPFQWYNFYEFWSS